MSKDNPIDRRTFPVKLPHIGDTSLWDTGLTIVYTFYNDFNRLDLQRKVWNKYTPKLKEAIKIILVDDCSDPPLKVEPIDIDLTVYRIKEDLKWNTPGAINLGITQADTNWVLNFASDCTLESDQLTKLMDLKPEDTWFYKLFRKRITNIKDWPKRLLHPHPEVFVHDRTCFLNMGGFDEDFVGERSGGYGIFDNYFSEKIIYFDYHLALIKEVLMIEWLEDITGGNIQLETGVDPHIVNINKVLWQEKKKILHKYKKNIEKSPMLRFKWEKVYG